MFYDVSLTNSLAEAIRASNYFCSFRLSNITAHSIVNCYYSQKHSNLFYGFY